jgi:hypothetical protein
LVSAGVARHASATVMRPIADEAGKRGRDIKSAGIKGD